ncbi:MAG TPA: penicillin-binding protein 2 [Candidatus Eremiobacteraceae bacterium]|nr:penicillin-binding protein 2 [Candidatus Eremiobacteraceae bacterium]
MRRRFAAFAVALAAVFVVLIWRLADMQLRHGAYYESLANLNQIRTIPVEAPRGLMYDRNGIVLVRNRPSFVVQIVPMQLRDPQSELQELGRILQQPEAALMRRLLHQNGVQYASFDALAQAVPLGPINIAEDLDTATVGRFEERADRLPGMSVQLVPVREYPNGTLGSHAVGYVGQISEAQYEALKSRGYGPDDIVGEEGLELTYDARLRGQRGGRQIKVDSAGEAVADIGEFAAVPGDDLDLTIDLPLQRAAETAMADQIKIVAARIGGRVGGSAIVEDPNTGAVLALVSQPNFDPNDFAAGISERQYAAYLDDPLLPLFDRAIAGAYPTGSTFKMITSSAALQTGVLTPDSTRYCPGVFDLNGYLFHDVEGGGHGTLAVRDAIAQSCDVFFYQVGNELGITRLDEFASAFGIGRETGIDLPGETSGTLPTPAWKRSVVKDDWYAGDTVNLSIGQGYLEASPIQMLQVVSAVANGGTIYTPYFVSDVRDPHGAVIERFGPRPRRRVPVSPDNLQVVREGMLGAIESPYGTAHNVEIEGFHYAGKTGTAENFPTIDNPEGRNHAWFVCFAPYDRPKIAVVVFMDQSGGFGAVNAAPVAQAIVAAYFHIRENGPNGSGIRD